jgi:site-specific DNA-methyltransferase (adenine-specific)/modification methylase
MIEMTETPTADSAEIARPMFSGVAPGWASDDGNVQLWNADCLDVLPLLSGIDAVITDPPYGIYKHGGKWGKKAELYWDTQTPDISGLLTMAPYVVIWGGNYFPLPPSRGWLSWFKPDSVPSAASMELAWTNQDMNSRQISQSIAATNAERVGHPTQKPIRVMVWTMVTARVPQGATVLDPFMGSGTTGVACIRSGRKFIGIERDAKYFEIAKERIRKELQVGRLF